jgi:hypothetical protein
VNAYLLKLYSYSRLLNPGGGRDFSPPFSPSLGPIQPPVQCVPGLPPGLSVNHPPHSAPRLKKEYSFTSILCPLGLVCGELYLHTTVEKRGISSADWGVDEVITTFPRSSVLGKLMNVCYETLSQRNMQVFVSKPRTYSTNFVTENACFEGETFRPMLFIRTLKIIGYGAVQWCHRNCPSASANHPVR